MNRLYTVDRAMEVASQLGISDRELCRRSGLHVSTIGKARLRGSELTVQTIVAICRAAGISLGEFFSGIDEMMNLEKK